MTPSGERPVAFASRTLNEAEKKYSQLDREGLALVFAVKRFHSFLYGRSFTLRTDHKPLLGLLGKTKNLPDAVPPRMKVLRLLHEGHPGICTMKRRARGQIWWPGMDTDIGDVTKVCDACQLNQPAAPKVASQPWQYPDAPWQRVHVDYAGPVEGKMLLIIVDAYSKWPDVWITNNVSAQTTIDHLRMTFATHGLPEVIVSDNGGCFTSKEFGEFMSANQIRHVFTPPLHPASNGQAESMVKLVKNGIKKQKPAPLLTKLQRWLFHASSVINYSTASDASSGR
ncbi:uncharacterized protein K02A2.6-like [Amphibalanus amphitrite]|uniref:uncharacterized protein K02A2.6-like n=1 Tax=Amphibalanus amphitrite TaxID=1232801 RepID=UPI001C904B5A|nr:uncharacterized protein K02A2.6-like [Amphibalanus amphitrite]